MRRPANELWLGNPTAQGSGVRIPIEVDVFGRTVVFWSHGDHGACAVCSVAPHAAWKRHLRVRLQSRVLPDGTAQHRLIRWCPGRNPRPAWPLPSWRSALA